MKPMKVQLQDFIEYSKPLTILYVEDDAVIRENGAALFQNLFGQVDVASDGVEALELFIKYEYDLVITDIRMPKMDGVELSRQIKAENIEQPILVISAHDDSYYLQDLLNIGVDYFLAKPLNLDLLFPTFKKICHQIYINNQVKLSEKKLIEYNDKLEKLNQDKDKFFSIISHDLKSPFNGLLGLTRIITEDGPEMEKEELLTINKALAKSADKAYALVESLLEWSLIQMGRLKPQPKPFLLSALVAEVFMMNKERSNQKGIQLLQSTPEGLEIMVDYEMTRSILHNLVSNALKFTPKGGKVEVSAVVIEAGWAKITVQDNGVGMSQEVQESLFRIDVQHSTAGTESESGTGLGLSLCKEMVEMHKGTIRVESTIKEGSSFSFTMPLSIGNVEEG